MKFSRCLAAMLLLAAALMTLASCQDIGSPLEGFTWQLLQYGNVLDLKKPVEGATVTAYFDSRDKMVSGTSGCNDYGGPYTVDHLTLTVAGPLNKTEKYCGAEQDALEIEYLNLLQKAERFELKNGQLTIFCGQDRLIFKNTNNTVKPPKFWGDSGKH